MKRILLILMGLLFLMACSTKTVDTSAAESLSGQCQGEDRFTCLTVKILPLIKANPESLKPLFEDFSTLLKDGTLTDDPRLFSPLIHELGMEMAFQKIPPEDASVICPLNFKAGCLHGVVMEYLDEVDSQDTLELARFCDFTLDDFFAYKNCIHGVGHALTAKTQGSLNEIVNKCKVLDSSVLSACASGVFMEYSTGVSGTGHHTHEQPVGSLILPCNEVDSEFQASCYSSLAAYRQYLPDTESFEATASLCEFAPEKHQDNCMLGLAEKIVTANAENFDASLALCKSIQTLPNLCETAIEQIKELESVL